MNDTLPGAGPVDLGLGPAPEPAGFRTRYRSEPGMIGHYPWTYYEPRRRSVDRPEHETEALYTADQVSAMLAAERERCEALRSVLRVIVEQDPVELALDPQWSQRIANRGLDATRGPNVVVTGKPPSGAAGAR